MPGAHSPGAGIHLIARQTSSYKGEGREGSETERQADLNRSSQNSKEELEGGVRTCAEEVANDGGAKGCRLKRTQEDLGGHVRA